MAVIEALEFYTDHQKRQHYDALDNTPAASELNRLVKGKLPVESSSTRPPERFRPLRPAAPPALGDLVAGPSEGVLSGTTPESPLPSLPPQTPDQTNIEENVSPILELPDTPTEVILTTKERLPSGETVERRSIIATANPSSNKPRALADAEAALEKPYQPANLRYSKMSGEQLMEQLRAIANKDDPNNSYSMIKKIGQG